MCAPPSPSLPLYSPPFHTHKHTSSFSPPSSSSSFHKATHASMRKRGDDNTCPGRSAVYQTPLKHVSPREFSLAGVHAKQAFCSSFLPVSYFPLPVGVTAAHCGHFTDTSRPQAPTASSEPILCEGGKGRDGLKCVHSPCHSRSFPPPCFLSLSLSLLSECQLSVFSG